MARPSFFIDDIAVTARELDVPEASFDDGMNLAGSNAPGVGINVDGGAVIGTPEQFTLLDQRGDVRVPQISQHIGGSGLGAGVPGTEPDGSVRAGVPSTDGDGSVPGLWENCGLAVLDDGWLAPVV